MAQRTFSWFFYLFVLSQLGEKSCSVGFPQLSLSIYWFRKSLTLPQVTGIEGWARGECWRRPGGAESLLPPPRHSVLSHSLPWQDAALRHGSLPSLPGHPLPSAGGLAFGSAVPRADRWLAMPFNIYKARACSRQELTPPLKFRICLPATKFH